MQLLEGTVDVHVVLNGKSIQGFDATKSVFLQTPLLTHQGHTRSPPLLLAEDVFYYFVIPRGEESHRKGWVSISFS